MREGRDEGRESGQGEEKGGRGDEGRSRGRGEGE